MARHKVEISGVNTANIKTAKEHLKIFSHFPPQKDFSLKRVCLNSRALAQVAEKLLILKFSQCSMEAI